MDSVNLIEELGLDGWGCEDGLQPEFYMVVPVFGLVTVKDNCGNWAVSGFGSLVGDGKHFADLFTAICWVEHLASFDVDLVGVGQYGTVHLERGSEWWQKDNYGGFNVWTDCGKFTNSREDAS